MANSVILPVSSFRLNPSATEIRLVHTRNLDGAPITMLVQKILDVPNGDVFLLPDGRVYSAPPAIELPSRQEIKKRKPTPQEENEDLLDVIAYKMRQGSVESTSHAIELWRCYVVALRSLGFEIISNKLLDHFCLVSCKDPGFLPLLDLAVKAVGEDAASCSKVVSTAVEKIEALAPNEKLIVWREILMHVKAAESHHAILSVLKALIKSIDRREDDQEELTVEEVAPLLVEAMKLSKNIGKINDHLWKEVVASICVPLLEKSAYLSSPFMILDLSEMMSNLLCRPGAKATLQKIKTPMKQLIHHLCEKSLVPDSDLEKFLLPVRRYLELCTPTERYAALQSLVLRPHRLFLKLAIEMVGRFVKDKESCQKQRKQRKQIHIAMCNAVINYCRNEYAEGTKFVEKLLVHLEKPEFSMLIRKFLYEMLDRFNSFPDSIAHNWDSFDEYLLRYLKHPFSDEKEKNLLLNRLLSIFITHRALFPFHFSNCLEKYLAFIDTRLSLKEEFLEPQFWNRLLLLARGGAVNGAHVVPFLIKLVKGYVDIGRFKESLTILYELTFAAPMHDGDELVQYREMFGNQFIELAPRVQLKRNEHEILRLFNKLNLIYTYESINSFSPKKPFLSQLMVAEDLKEVVNRWLSCNSPVTDEVANTLAFRLDKELPECSASLMIPVYKLLAEKLRNLPYLETHAGKTCTVSGVHSMVLAHTMMIQELRRPSVDLVLKSDFIIKEHIRALSHPSLNINNWISYSQLHRQYLLSLYAKGLYNEDFERFLSYQREWISLAKQKFLGEDSERYYRVIAVHVLKVYAGISHEIHKNSYLINCIEQINDIHGDDEVASEIVEWCRSFIKPELYPST